MRIEVTDMRDGYSEIVHRVLKQGKRVKVRDQKTYELLDVTVVLNNPTDALPIGVGRKPSLGIAALEALQLIGGVSYPHLMLKASSAFGQFMDDGTYHGAYGPRIRAQLPAVVNRLRTDHSTRQAVVVLWDPLQDLMVPDSRDYPCTVMLQFLFRDDALQLHTTMRSNDVWLGLAYDAFQFTQLQITVAHVLRMTVGPYFHHAVSMHLYERDAEAACRLTTPGDIDAPAAGPRGMQGLTIVESMTHARRLLNGLSTGGMYAWYEKALAKVLP